MSGQRISQFPAASSAQAADELVANQSGTTRKVTVAQLRAGLAPASHTHGVADIVGQIPPARLDQAGAQTGQVLKWNGSAWAPAPDEAGSGGGSVSWSAITALPAAIDAIDNLTPAADRIAFYTGAATASLTPLTSFARSLLDDTDAAQARATIGAAAATHTHGLADIVGQIPPARLDQAGAQTGQVLKWNGSAWAPAPDEAGSGGGSVSWSAITALPAAIDAIDNLTPAADRIAFYTGANTASLTPLTSFARSLLDDADAAQARATIGAAPATHGHTSADISDFAAATRGQVEGMLVAGANISVTYSGSGATRQATIAVVSSSTSYTAVTASRTLTAADNGRVLEGGATDVTLTLPAGLGKGFSCLLRRVGTGNLTATAGSGVTFAPAAGPIATTAQWDEIAIECVADSGTAATFLVRRIAA